MHMKRSTRLQNFNYNVQVDIDTRDLCPIDIIWIRSLIYILKVHVGLIEKKKAFLKEFAEVNWR